MSVRFICSGSHGEISHMNQKTVEFVFVCVLGNCWPTKYGGLKNMKVGLSDQGGNHGSDGFGLTV